VSNNKRKNMKEKISKERRKAEKELLFYLRYFKKFAPDSRAKFDYEIDRLVEKLKEME
jgi:hypothetical protein